MVKQLQFGLLFLITALFATSGFSQKWYEMTLESQVKIEEVKAEAEKHFATIGTGPHTGYNSYLRWLHNASLHMDENGYLYTYDHLLKEKKKFNKNAPKNRAVDTEGDWSAAGPFNYTATSSWSPGQGRITAIAVEPINQELLFVGTPCGGIWRSTDAGASWEPKGDNLDNLGIYAIAIDPNNTNHILLLNSGSNILESFDQGDTWSTLTKLGNRTEGAQMIRFHPTNSSIYFVSERSGFFKTTDAGASFTEVIDSDIEDVFFKPGDVNTMYAAGSDFWKSTDLGETWTKITNGISISDRMRITVTEADPNRVYIVQQLNGGFGRMYKSTDSGNSFEIMADRDKGAPNYIGAQGGRDMAIMCSSTDPDEVHIAGLNNYRSQNGGETFTSLADWNRPNDPSYIHADVELMINVNGTLYAGTDGGIYRSKNAGNNYEDLTLGGLAISQFFRFGSSAPYPGTGVGSDPDRIVGGTQDNGTMIARGANKDWISWLGADGMESFIDYEDDDIIYGTVQTGVLYRSTDGGVTNRLLNKPTRDNGNFITPFEMDPQVHTTIYSAYKEVYRSTNSGTSWEAITPGLAEGNIDELAIAPSDNNYIYFADREQLWVSTNAQSNNRTWTEITGMDNTITYITIDPNDPTHVILTYQGTNVYETKNAGATWNDITGNLPNIGAFCALMDNTDENGIYVGMRNGVYYKDDSMTDWELFGNGLPNCDVRELEINYQANKLRVATFGRGIWEIGIFETREEITPQITVETIGDKCIGDTIVLAVVNDPSWIAPVSYEWYQDGILISGATSSSYGAQENANYYAKVITGDASGTSSSEAISFVDLPGKPQVSVERICGAGAVTLTATGTGDGVIKWFSDVEAENELAEGDSYSVDISETSTFYVKEISNGTFCSGLTNEAMAIVITRLDKPEVENQITCTTGEVVLTATTSQDGTIRWYNADNPNDIIGTGSTLITNVQDTSTFLVDIEPESTSLGLVGMELEGAAGASTSGNWGLHFDVFQDLTLIAVQVDAQGAGERTIQVFDADEELIWSKAVDLIDGVQRVELNVNLETGNDYRIGAPNGSNLFRTTGDDGGVDYPYNLDGLLSIRGSFRYTSPSLFTTSYYFFYDWEVGISQEGCVSEKATLTVTLDNCVGLTDNQSKNLIVYPNPSSGIINLQLPEDFDLQAIEVTDLRGNALLAFGEYVDQIDLQGFKAGVYLVRVAGEQGTKVFKVEVR